MLRPTLLCHPQGCSNTNVLSDVRRLHYFVTTVGWFWYYYSFCVAKYSGNVCVTYFQLECCERVELVPVNAIKLYRRSGGVVALIRNMVAVPGSALSRDCLLHSYVVTVAAILQTLGVFSRSGIAAAMLMYIPVVWDMTECRSAGINQCFGETYCFPLLRLEWHRTAVVIHWPAAWRLSIANTLRSVK